MPRDDVEQVIRDAQEAAGNVLRRRMPADITGLVLVIPVYRAAIADPRSGWRRDVLEAVRQAIEPPAAPGSRIIIPH